MRFLLDTNIVSELGRPEPDAGIVSRFRRHIDESALAAPVWNELLYGLELLPPGRKRQQLHDFLAQVIAPNLTVLPYDRPAAEWHAAERARLRRKGALPPFIDGQIAAVAAVHGLTLVTRNRKDFARFRGIPVTDWRRPGPA